MEKFSVCKIILIVMLFSVGEEWRVARATDDFAFREMDVSVVWPELEVDVIPGRGKQFSFVKVSEVQAPCAKSPSWISTAQFGIIATGDLPSDLHLTTDERVYAITCPSDEGGATRNLDDQFIPAEFDLQKTTGRKRNRVSQEYGKSTYKVESTLMGGIGTVLNALIPKMHKDNKDIENKIRLDTVWEIIIKELFQLTRINAVEPTNTVLAAYNSLPDEYNGNEAAFSGFYTTFGTDSVIKIAVGGIYSFKRCVNSAGDLVLPNTHNNSNEVTNTSFIWETYSIGGSRTKTVEEWENSVSEAPGPLWFVSNPLTQILDPANKNPVKIDSFIKGRAIEQSYYKFKMEAQNLLSFLPSDGNKLQRFFRELLTRQLGYIKPSPELIETLQKELTNNPELNKYRVTCRKKSSARDLRFYIITGLCITFPNTSCQFITSNLQESQLNFDFFFQPNCEGKVVSSKVKKRYRMPGSEFETYRSVRLVKTSPSHY